MKINFQKTALAVGITAALVGTSAMAHDWSGAYVGGKAGSGSLSETGNSYYGDVSNTDMGMVAALTAGYNMQKGAAVLGVEADYNFGNMDSRSTDIDGGGYYVTEAKWKWYSTVRARAGLAVDNVLLYVTGGIAAVNADYSYTYDVGFPNGDDASASGTKYGTAFGGGIEVALDNNLSIKGEIMRVEMPSYKTQRVNGDSAQFTSSMNTVQIGANWKF